MSKNNLHKFIMAYSRARDIESSENSAFMDSETSTHSKMTSKNNTFQFLKRKRAIKRKIIFSVYFSFAFLIVCVVLPLKWISMSNEFASQFGIHTLADGDFIRSQDRGSAFLHFGSERARRADSTDRNEFMNQVEFLCSWRLQLDNDIFKKKTKM